MKTFTSNFITDLSPTEAMKINGGETGDLLYYIAYGISFYISMELKILKTGIDMAATTIKAAETAWKEAPVSVAEWN